LRYTQHCMKFFHSHLLLVFDQVDENCSYELTNDKIESIDNITPFAIQNREGGIEVHTTLHETFPLPSSSRMPLSGNLNYEVSETSL